MPAKLKTFCDVPQTKFTMYVLELGKSTSDHGRSSPLNEKMEGK